MKIKDFIWIFSLVSITLFIFLPTTNTIFVKLTTNHPYMMGFLKTMILASMGEILVKRFKTGFYFSDKGFYLKALIWGILGLMFVFVFPLFDGGIRYIFRNRTFFNNLFMNSFLYALIISASMNLIFAPTFMLLHRITDAYIDLSEGSIKRISNISIDQIIEKINFKFFISFVLLKTIPLFWIPAHTLTFMLPHTYRVLMASYLSIALGILLSIKSKK